MTIFIIDIFDYCCMYLIKYGGTVQCSIDTYPVGQTEGPPTNNYHEIMKVPTTMRKKKHYCRKQISQFTTHFFLSFS